MSFIQKRSLSLFGDLGDNVSKIVAKEHVFFKVKRPIGFREKPIHVSEQLKKKGQTKSISLPRKIWNFYFDGVTRKTRVKQLQKEMAYGGFYDFHVYNKTKGRLFGCPPSYFKREKALYFPNFRVKKLDGGQIELMDAFARSACTILRVFSTQSGAQMTRDYFKIPGSSDSYLSDSGIKIFDQSYPNAQISQIILSESWVKYLMHVFVSTGKLRKMVPKELHDNFFVAMRDDVLQLNDRQKLLMTNVYSGYIFVIDNSSRVRWIGSGWPEKEDVSGLWRAVKGVSHEASTNKSH